MIQQHERRLFGATRLVMVGRPCRVQSHDTPAGLKRSTQHASRHIVFAYLIINVSPVGAGELPLLDDYQVIAEECFRRAQEAQTDSERRGYLELAKTWLEAATKMDCGPGILALPSCHWR